MVELRYEAPVAFSARRFAAPAAAEPQADSLNEVLSKFDIKSMRSQFHLSADTIRSRVEVAATLPSEPQPTRFAKRGMDTDFIQSGFVQVVPKSGADARKIVTALKRQKAVWDAYVFVCGAGRTCRRGLGPHHSDITGMKIPRDIGASEFVRALRVLGYESSR